MENLLTDSTGFQVEGMHILDIGASTGGFIDCLLQKGASNATCIDVGHGQLHYRLRTDKRVNNFEKTNIRNVCPKDIPGVLSFYRNRPFLRISLRKIFATICVCERRKNRRTY